MMILPPICIWPRKTFANRHGLLAYEVSNHAKPGAQSRHNLIYWRYGDYAGIGPRRAWAANAARHPLGHTDAADAEYMAEPSE